MEQQEDSSSPQPPRKPGIKRVTDHLANERTFLAWMRTGLATITLGFMVARFGLFLRELKGKTAAPAPDASFHFSSTIGIALAILGVVTILSAFLNFLYVRHAIDAEQFYPKVGLIILLTILASGIGFLLVIYLFFTA